MNLFIMDLSLLGQNNMHWKIWEIVIRMSTSNILEGLFVGWYDF